MRSSSCSTLQAPVFLLRRRISTHLIHPNVRSLSSSDEVHKFSQLASEWWNPQKNPLLAMNPIRMQFMRECLHMLTVNPDPPSATQHTIENPSSSAQSSLHILDVGCGGGLLAESWVRTMRNYNAQVVGVDPSAPLLQVAQQHAASTLPRHLQSRLHYRCGTLEEALPDANPPSFDIISCCDVLEHVPDPAALIYAMSQRLHPGGLLFCSTLNRTFQSFLLSIVAAEYLFGLVPRGTHTHAQYLAPAQVAAYTAAAGLVSRRVSGMVLPTIALPAALMGRQWAWQLHESDTQVNWIGCYQKEIIQS